MKPIEIHIEGYKIVISKDEPLEVAKDNEKIIYAPCPLPKDGFQQSPYTVTLTDSINLVQSR